MFRVSVFMISRMVHRLVHLRACSGKTSLADGERDAVFNNRSTDCRRDDCVAECLDLYNPPPTPPCASIAGSCDRRIVGLFSAFIRSVSAAALVSAAAPEMSELQGQKQTLLELKPGVAD